MTDYEIWLINHNRDRFDLLDDAIWWQWARIVNQVGYFQVALPNDYPLERLRKDYILEIWRGTEQVPIRRELVGFVRKPELDTAQSGLQTVFANGPDSNDLLRRRIVAYAAGSDEAKKVDVADDMMKAVVRENMGSLAPAARQFRSDRFSVQADRSIGPSLTYSFAWRNVMDVLRDISEKSRVATPEIFFDVVPIQIGEFDFRTYSTRPGVDRTQSTGSHPIVFSLERGNLAEPRVVFDSSNERNHIYAGGQGEEGDREIKETSDSSLENMSPWARREGFVDARQEAQPAGVQDEADKGLSEGRPKIRFTGRLLDDDITRYGRHWDLGDEVTAEFAGREFDCLIRSILVAVDSNGKETIDARMEAEDVL